jgi:UDP-glucuronate 4-epimerase
MMTKLRKVLVTGGAGFIGSHLVDRLVERGDDVTVIDNFDPLYAPESKRRNVAPHAGKANYRLYEADIRDMERLRDMLKGQGFDVICHLAAKAGVRPSIKDPIAYQEVNVFGTQNLLEIAREKGVKQFVFASSSSVYGVNPNVPWREEDHVLMPISPYASTKVSGELLGHVYSHLYGIRFLVLRFFTVYGPRQRPDLAIHKFTRMMLEGHPIPVFGDGSTRRDYTFVGDTVKGLMAAMDYTATNYEVINMGNNRTVSLNELIETLEEVLGIKAKRETKPLQAGDVPQTWASVEKSQALLGFRPNTPFKEGIRAFAEWYEKAQRAYEVIQRALDSGGCAS